MDFEAEVKAKYEYMSDCEVLRLVNRAKAICIDEMFPADRSINYLNFDWENEPRLEMWILDCVDELVERTGMSTATAYRENGMAWTFDRAGVSQALLDRLPRMARSIRG